jgi:hypothetical protein
MRKMKMMRFCCSSIVMEHWWIEIDRGKSKYSKKNLLQCHFVHHKTHMADPGLNQGFHGERPATNHLSHGTAL